MKSPTLGKRKPNFDIGLIIIKANIEHLERGHPKVLQKLFHTHYCLDGHSGIEDWDFVIFLAMRNTCATERKRNIFATQT